MVVMVTYYVKMVVMVTYYVSMGWGSEIMTLLASV